MSIELGKADEFSLYWDQAEPGFFYLGYSQLAFSPLNRSGLVQDVAKLPLASIPRLLEVLEGWAQSYYDEGQYWAAENCSVYLLGGNYDHITWVYFAPDDCALDPVLRASGKGIAEIDWYEREDLATQLRRLQKSVTLLLELQDSLDNITSISLGGAA